MTQNAIYAFANQTVKFLVITMWFSNFQPKIGPALAQRRVVFLHTQYRLSLKKRKEAFLVLCTDAYWQPKVRPCQTMTKKTLLCQADRVPQPPWARRLRSLPTRSSGPIRQSPLRGSKNAAGPENKAFPPAAPNTPPAPNRRWPSSWSPARSTLETALP